MFETVDTSHLETPSYMGLSSASIPKGNSVDHSMSILQPQFCHLDKPSYHSSSLIFEVEPKGGSLDSLAVTNDSLPEHTQTELESQSPIPASTNLQVKDESSALESISAPWADQDRNELRPQSQALMEYTPNRKVDETEKNMQIKAVNNVQITPEEQLFRLPVTEPSIALGQASLTNDTLFETSTTPLRASTRLRQMIKTSPRIIVCPGVYDGLSARIALEVGFKAMYMTGAGTTASRLGAADLGLAQLYDMRTNAEMIANLQPDGPPLIADMDTGYGGPMVIAKAVQQYHLAGVAGFHIEDQVLQKRCGHLQGKEVVDVETYIQRIKACVFAAKKLHSDIFIIARTDALQSRGYEDCIDRLRRASEAGADMGILEGCTTKEQAAQAVRDLAPWPLCLNSVENGVSPLITAEEAQIMGYRAMVFSFASIAPAYTAIKNTFERLMDSGVTGSNVTPKTIFQVCGLNESMTIDEAAGGTAFLKGV